MTSGAPTQKMRRASIQPPQEDEPIADGFRSVVLRKGDGDAPLFLFPGLTGEPDELTALATELDTQRAVIALTPNPYEIDGTPINRIKRMAELAIERMRTFQTSGPYNIGGYSFGGLVAFEIARQLAAVGETVDSLFLIEAMFDERYWPKVVWARAMIRRAGWQLIRIAQMNPRTAWQETWFSAARLSSRLHRRFTRTRISANFSHGDILPLRRNAVDAMAHYQPLRYEGPLTLIAPRVDHNFGCKAITLWRRLAEPIEALLISGDHLSIVRDRQSVRSVAEIIANRLPTHQPALAGLQPICGFARPMLVSTMRWLSTARVAHSLAEAGFAVTSCLPDGHPLAAVSKVSDRYRLSAGRSMETLYHAIRQAGPDILLPDDERAIELLARLGDHVANRDPKTAALIARSIGRSNGIALAGASRASVMTEALKMGIPCPITKAVENCDELASWSLPFVLKTDGSWGGQGVAVVRQADHLTPAWRRLSGPPSLARALKRLLMNQEIDAIRAWLLCRRATVNAQIYVQGRQAIATIACCDGRITNIACFDVVRSADVNGPATVVRILAHPGMSRAAELLVQRFHLSGFCGLDFQLDHDGVAHLVEVNARVTPTCHLLVEQPTATTIALFPQELLRDPESTFKPDRPRNGSALIAIGMDQLRRRHSVSMRLTRKLTKQFR
jgi:thioesterase domain-containing protein